MFGKHIKAASLAITLGLVAVMFFVVMILNANNLDSANPVAAVVLLLLVIAAIIPVFAAHERHN